MRKQSLTLLSWIGGIVQSGVLGIYTGSQKKIEQAASAASHFVTTTGKYAMVERCKALGIALVVFGHLTDNPLTGHTPDWYQSIWRLIYSFHMPLFMMISGMLFFHSSLIRSGPPALQNILKLKFRRLIVPGIIMITAIMIAKMLVSGYAVSRDPYTGVSEFFAGVIMNTPTNPALEVWYLVVLFIYAIVTPFLYFLNRRYSLYFMLAGSVLLHYWHPTPLFYANRLLNYYVFFMIGATIEMHKEQFLRFMRYLHIPLLGLLFVMLALGSNPMNHRLLFGAAISSMLIYYMIAPLPKIDDILSFFGKRTLVIYMFNAIFCGGARLLVWLAFGVEFIFNPAGILFIFSVGLLGPILLLETCERLPVARRLAVYLK